MLFFPWFSTSGWLNWIVLARGYLERYLLTANRGAWIDGRMDGWVVADYFFLFFILFSSLMCVARERLPSASRAPKIDWCVLFLEAEDTTLRRTGSTRPFTP